MTGKILALNIVKGTAATLAFFLASVFIGPLAFIFAPFPVLYYGLKGGRNTGVIIVVAATLILCLTNPFTALSYLLQCGLLGLLMAEFLLRDKGLGKTVSYAVVINLSIILSVTFAYGYWRDIDINGLVTKGINEIVSLAEEFYRASGVSAKDLASMQQALKQVAGFIARTYPALLLVCLGGIAGLNLLLLKKFVHRLPRQLHFEEFARYKNPEQLIWVVIVSGFALLLDNALVKDAAINVLIVALCLYFVQGLSITSYYFARFAVPRFVRMLFYALLVLQPYLPIAVVALGLFDLWCNFRTPKPNENL